MARERSRAKLAGMSIITPEPEVPAASAPPEPQQQELRELRDEVRRQGASIRATERSFVIFAVLALLLAMATLLAVALKLDGKSSSGKATPTPAPAAAATKAPAAAPALGHAVTVGLGEFFVRPSANAAAAGKVRFTVHNGGSATHEFVVIRTDKPAAGLMKGARADESGNVGETGDLKAGATKAITLNLKAGHYALICNLPGHYKAGQHTDFTVR
jgi:uncharacterized cupredoxin-like copper-binding protein